MRDATKRKVDRLLKSAVNTASESQAFLVPVSGGSDSAFVFWLLNQAFPEKVLGVYANSNANPIRGNRWFGTIGDMMSIMTPGPQSQAEEMRWAKFMAMSLASKAWLVGSRNRTENELGTYSLASRVATYLPLVGVWKSDVMKLCRYVGIPDEIIESSRRADPDCGRPKELAEIPFEYVDIYLRMREAGSSMHPLTHEQIAYLNSVYDYNSFKKTLPLRGPKL